MFQKGNLESAEKFMMTLLKADFFSKSQSFHQIIAFQKILFRSSGRMSVKWGYGAFAFSQMKLYAFRTNIGGCKGLGPFLS